MLCPENFKSPPTGFESIPLTMRLASLSLWLFSASHAPSTSSGFLLALFTPSSESLTTLRLRLYDAASERPLHSTFHIIGHALRTLTLELAAPHNPCKGHFELLGTCTSLFELRLIKIPEQGVNMEPLSAGYIRAILDALPSPPTLDRLGLGIEKSEDLEPLLLLVDHLSLSKLNRLHFPALLPSPEEAAPPLVQAWKQACDERGIRLEFGGGDSV